MPKVTARAKALDDLDCMIKMAMQFHLLVDSDSDDDDLDDPFLELGRIPSLDELLDDCLESSNDEGLDLYMIVAGMHHTINNTRYLEPRINTLKSKEFVIDFFLSLPDADFRIMTRLTKPTFWYVHDLIKDNPIFHNHSYHAQAPVHWQLACALDRLGNDGNGTSIGRSKTIWGVSHGTVCGYYDRVVAALGDICSDHLHWPDFEERLQISSRMAMKGFKNAVGFVDGTTFPLHQKPSTHGNSYLDRKKRYSINAQVVCDDKYRIRHFMTEMPGRCHDSRIFGQSPLVTTPANFFSDGQYLLADSGYSASEFLVPAYKDRQRDYRNDPSEPLEIERFNTFLAKARVVNEHCIGILKARWTSFRGLRIELTEPSDITRVIHHARACVALHNIALQWDPWEENDIQADDLDDTPLPAAAAEDDSAIRALSTGQKKRLQVRKSCLAFHAR